MSKTLYFPLLKTTTIESHSPPRLWRRDEEYVCTCTRGVQCENQAEYGLCCRCVGLPVVVKDMVCTPCSVYRAGEDFECAQCNEDAEYCDRVEGENTDTCCTCAGEELCDGCAENWMLTHE